MENDSFGYMEGSRMVMEGSAGYLGFGLPNNWCLGRSHEIAEKIMVGIACAATHVYTEAGD